MLVGAPGSGKSTWLKAHRENNKESFVLSTDAFIEYQAVRQGKTYNDVFKETFKEANQWLNDCLKCAVKDGTDMYWDQTNVNASSRKKKLARIPKDYKKVAVYFSCNRQELQKVNQERKEIGRSLPDNILESMLSQLTMPSKEEGFDEIIVVSR